MVVGVDAKTPPAVPPSFSMATVHSTVMTLAKAAATRT